MEPVDFHDKVADFCLKTFLFLINDFLLYFTV
jgi:hypothetical protein